MDSLRLGAVVRAVRLRKGWRQADVAGVARVSTATVSRVERGSFDPISVGVLLRIAAAMEIRIEWMPRWRGGELDRMMNAGHSAMHEAAALELAGTDWQTAAETTFAIYGERGVIDILGFHPASGALLVIELKTDLVDVQGLIGAVDRYRRLAPTVARERGWSPTSVSCWVLLRDSPSNPSEALGTRDRAAPCLPRRRTQDARMAPQGPLAPSPPCLSYRILMHGGLAALPRASNESVERDRGRAPWSILSG